MNNSYIQILKACIYAIALPLICIYIFLSQSTSDKTFEEYQLLTQRKEMVIGHLIKAEEFEEEIESNDSRTVDIVSGYQFDYIFKTNSGQQISATDGQYRNLPLNKEISDIPYEINVEYNVDNPKINRVQGLIQNNDTLWNWFRRKIMMSIIVFLFCIYFSYVISKPEFKKINR